MNRNEKTGVMRWLWRALAAGVAVVLIAAGAVIATGLLANAPVADVAVVLGNTVAADGKPSPRLAARLDRACDCMACLLYTSDAADE